MPVDPYCDRQKLQPLKATDDPNVQALQKYAKGMGVKLHQTNDGKLFASSKMWNDVPITASLEGEGAGQSAARLLSALREINKTARQRSKIRRTVNQAIETNQLPAHQPPMSINKMYESVIPFLNDAPSMTETARYTTGFRVLAGNRFIVPVESALSRLGSEGNSLANLFRQANELHARLQGNALNELEIALEKLTPDEIAVDFQRFIEKGLAKNQARRPVLEEAFGKVKRIMDEYYDTAQRLGIDVGPRISPDELVTTGNYFPHRFDMKLLRDKRLSRKLIDDVITERAARGESITREQAIGILDARGLGSNRELAIRKLIKQAAKRGKAMTSEEAESVLDNYINKNAERISGALERPRLGIDGYITDARQAYAATIMRNSRRIAEWSVYGRKDERVHALLGRMRDNPSGHDFARQAYYLEIGKEGAHLEGVSQLLYDWQAAKLSLAVLANMTQPINAFIRVGFKPFVQAFAETFPKLQRGQGRVALRDMAERAGSIPTRISQSDDNLALVQDMLSSIQERGFHWWERTPTAVERDVAARLASKTVRSVANVSLAVFERIEMFNRALSTRAGEIYFERLVKTAAQANNDAVRRSVARRVSELGFTPEFFNRQIAENNTSVLKEMGVLAGQRVSNVTQFRSGIQNLPLWATQSVGGRFIAQFKTYTLNQTRFMLREIGGPHNDPTRRVRAVAALLAAYPAAGVLVAGARSLLLGPTEATRVISDWLDDPNAWNTLQTLVVAQTMSGGLGIVQDIALGGMIGNRFNQTNLIMPPIASSALNALDAIGSLSRAMISDEPIEELRRARSAVLREGGGVGAFFDTNIRIQEGIEERTIDPITEFIRNL